MDAIELAKKTQKSKRHIDYILNGDRRPSPEMAIILEKATGIDRRAWLWPDEFQNPMLKGK